MLEYNVRFGDPETEALLLLLEDGIDLAEILLVRAPGTLIFPFSDPDMFPGLCGSSS